MFVGLGGAERWWGEDLNLSFGGRPHRGRPLFMGEELTNIDTTDSNESKLKQHFHISNYRLL